MKALFTGSREWTNEDPVVGWLCDFPPNSTIIHGAALNWKWTDDNYPLGGLDRIVDRWARELGHRVKAYPVDHALHGPWPAAGNFRNQSMIDNEHRPDSPIDLCLAFPLESSRGTWNMIYLAKIAHIPVWEAPKALWR